LKDIHTVIYAIAITITMKKRQKLHTYKLTQTLQWKIMVMK